MIQISKNSSFLYLLHFYSRCNAGFTGKHCNLTCAKGFYGVNCIKQCQCENSGICSRVNGSCSCTAGWFGTNCDYTCDLGNYGPNVRIIVVVFMVLVIVLMANVLVLMSTKEVIAPKVRTFSFTRLSLLSTCSKLTIETLEESVKYV